MYNHLLFNYWVKSRTEEWIPLSSEIFLFSYHVEPSPLLSVLLPVQAPLSLFIIVIERERALRWREQDEENAREEARLSAAALDREAQMRRRAEEDARRRREDEAWLLVTRDRDALAQRRALGTTPLSIPSCHSALSLLCWSPGKFVLGQLTEVCREARARGGAA